MPKSNRLRIVTLTGISRSAGGLFYAVSSLCKELQTKSAQVVVLGADNGFVEEDRVVWGKTDVIPYKAYGPMGFSVALQRGLIEKNADLIHQHGIWMNDQWAALRWQKKTGRPVVISPHGMLDPWALQNSAWKKKLAGILFANQSLQKATCIHALCRSEADSIRGYGLKNPITIIPNGVELPEIGGRRTEAGGQKGKKQLLFLGRIHPKKGLSELIEAWAKAKSQKPKAFSNWQLLIAGWDDGNHLAGLKQLASQLDLSWSDEDHLSDPRPPSSDLCSPTSDLCFIGSKYGEEKERLLRSVDAFILPSFSEGLPMSVLEAWSYQLPVVMTDCCNLPEGFEADAAIRVEPHAESIAAGLIGLFKMSNEDRNAMGSNGRELVEGKFTWPRIAENMHAVYEWCLSGKNPPGCMEF